MKKIKFKKPGTGFLMLIFWTVSIFFWNIYLYPNVDPQNITQTGNYFYYVLFSNYLILIYFLFPFIWFVRKIHFSVKIIVSAIFILIFILWVLKGIKIYDELKEISETKKIIKTSTSYFIHYFGYVLIFHISIIAAVIFNLKVLIPRFMNKIRFRIYLLTSTGLIVFASTFNYSLFNFAIDKLFPNLFYLSYYKLWELCLIIAAYLLFTSGVLLTWQYRQMLIAKRESVQNELSALKAQINPHFLFNNLNTIYGMALQQDYRTPDAILQLSDFLRYVLYDTSSDFIELAKEVEILDTYISLQKERINPLITKVEWVAEGNFENVMIAPLLLLPLAENCFKYGKGRQKGKIVISLRFDGRKLTFETENNIARCDKPNGVKSSGLGIHNVVKRLNLIYPGKFVLTYYETEGIFKLEMCIELARS